MIVAATESVSRSIGVPHLTWVFAAVGGAALVGGLAFEPGQTWVNLFLIGNFVIGLGLGGLLFGALLDVTGARWSRSIRPIADAMPGVLPIGAILMAIVLISRPSLYAWAAEQNSENPASPLKAFWLNRPFFLLRSGIYLTVWVLFALATMRRTMRSSDQTLPPTSRSKFAALFLVVFGITCWFASYDWIMSLEPEWTSTIFGVYYFAGLISSGVAGLIVVAIFMRRFSSRPPALAENQLQDLGTLLFGFSCFWMYIWFCQYLLIWYVNNSEETVYFRVRQNGPWLNWIYLDLACNWAIPFVVLLFRSAKRNPVVLGVVAAIVLIGRWVDLSVMVIPTQHHLDSTPGIFEVAQIVGAAGACFMLVSAVASRQPSTREQTPVVPGANSEH